MIRRVSAQFHTLILEIAILLGGALLVWRAFS
jgi:hypothetical protein